MNDKLGYHTVLRTTKKQPSMKKLDYLFEIKRVYTGPLLYIVRNNGNSQDENNRSILGIFTTAKEAKDAIVLAKDIQKANNVSANMEIKVVIPNLSMYYGCSAFPISMLLDDPYRYEQEVREWQTWSTFIELHNENYGQK